MCNISANSLHPYQRAEGITYENAKPDYTTKEENVMPKLTAKDILAMSPEEKK